MTEEKKKVVALLSGGLDSSIVCSLVNKYSKDILETYSIGLSGSTDLMYAREVSKYLGTEHKEILVTEDEFFNAIDGQNLTDEYMKNNEYDTLNEWIDPFHKRKITKGEIGCSLSHYGVYDKAFSMDHEITLILEDDTEFVRNYNELFNDLNVIDWGQIPNFDIIINATSLGLSKDDKIDLNFSKIGKYKLFYDVIYNPIETNFLREGKELGNISEVARIVGIDRRTLQRKMIAWGLRDDEKKPPRVNQYPDR